MYIINKDLVKQAQEKALFNWEEAMSILKNAYVKVNPIVF